jgi:hypothetical protein
METDDVCLFTQGSLIENRQRIDIMKRRSQANENPADKRDDLKEKKRLHSSQEEISNAR